MSNIEKKYVDYAGLQSYDSQIKGVISTDFVGATSSVDGAAGRVPAPESGDENKYLRGDGTWSSVTDGVTGVKGNAETDYRNGNVNITPANIGLGNVDNTSDANKPVSTAAGNELQVLRNVNSFNIIPYTTVKSTTIGGLTITNNLDGSYTLDGTTTNLLLIDFISGEIYVDPVHFGGLAPVPEPFHLSSARAFKMTVGCDDPSAFYGQLQFYVNLLDENGYTLAATATNSGVDTYTFTTQLASEVKYATYHLKINNNFTYDNVTICPACWDAASSITSPGAGALSNAALFDYVQRYMKPTFIGTRAEWTALYPIAKGYFKVVILTDD